MPQWSGQNSTGTNGPNGLLVAVRSGDELAARALWAAHAGRLHGIARAITGSSHDAADAVQDAFVGLLGLSAAHAAKVDDVGAYLAGAVRGRALNLLRGESRRAAREGEATRAGVLRLVREDDVAGYEDLHHAVGRLPLEQREVIALKHFGGLTFEQVAAVLSVPRSTAASRHVAAVEALRVMLVSDEEVARVC